MDNETIKIQIMNTYGSTKNKRYYEPEMIKLAINTVQSNLAIIKNRSDSDFNKAESEDNK